MFTEYDMDPRVKFPDPDDKALFTIDPELEKWMNNYETALEELRMILENIPRIPINLRSFRKLYYLAHGELPEDVL